jgi:hypothetical protein
MSQFSARPCVNLRLAPRSPATSPAASRFTRQLAAGIFSYLPLTARLDKSRIIHEEMQRSAGRDHHAGGTPGGNLKETALVPDRRRDGPVQGPLGRTWCQMIYEEVIADLVRKEVRSTGSFHRCFTDPNQVADDPRPRGPIRARPP